MKQRTVRACVVVAFAIALGHLAWHALFGPAPLPEYLVQGEGPALCGRSPDDHHLYVRREIYLSQRPRHAWLQVLARDRLRVYVNGKFLGQQALPGFPVAVVADLAPYLQVGRNCIALSTEQATIGKPPVITVTGAYAYDDQEYALGVDALWRCSPVFERTACWWFETDFDDRHWPAAQRTACHLRGRVKAPPRAVTEVSQAQWITPAELEANTAAVRREFEIADRPRQAWLRVTATGSYRLALNGILLDQQEGELGGLVAAPVVQRIYDITPVMRRGQNVLALVLTGIAGRRPHVLVDGEVEDSWGRRQRVRSDAHWLGRPGLRSDWLALARDHEYPGWQPC